LDYSLESGDPGLGSRFLQEARVSARIRSVHVTHVTDVDQIIHRLDSELDRLDSDMATGEGDVQ